jgi:hypothetical protein
LQLWPLPSQRDDNGDLLPDDVPMRALCPRMVRTRCGMIGANVRPDYFNKPRV